MIIDVHTHILNEKVYKDYLAKAGRRISKSVIIHDYKEPLKKYLDMSEKYPNLHLVAYVDMYKDIKKQLAFIEELFKKKKAVGIKLYPGYQHFFPSDKKVYPIARLCQKYNKPLVFHTGDVWDPIGTAILKYSHPIHVDELAVNFPKCKIIISHFGFPYFLEAANVVSKNKNVFTDVSGTIDDCSKSEMSALLKQYIADLKRAFAYYPDVKRKTMFGTDYGGEHTPLNQIQPYIDLVKSVFSKKEQENVFHKLAEKVYFQ